MAIELSNVTFTEQDDVVPASGVEKILNTGIANTLAGDDIINGESGNLIPTSGPQENVAILNTGTLNTDGGSDRITGTYNDQSNIRIYRGYGIYNVKGVIDTGDGNDIFMGLININSSDSNVSGIYNVEGVIDTGEGDDTIIGTDNSTEGDFWSYGFYNESGTLNTGNGNDLITGNGKDLGIFTPRSS